MRSVAVVFSAVFGLLLMAVSFVCARAANRDHLSPWWLGSYSSLIAGLVVLTVPTFGGA